MPPSSPPATLASLLRAESAEEAAQLRRQASLSARARFDSEVHVFTQRMMDSLKQTSIKTLSCADVVMVMFRWTRLGIGLVLLILTLVAGEEHWIIGDINAWFWLAWATITALSASFLSFFLVQKSWAQSGLLMVNKVVGFYYKNSGAAFAVLMWSFISFAAWLALLTPRFDYTQAAWSYVNFYVTRAYAALIIGAFLGVLCGITTAWISAHHERVSYVDKIIDALRTTYLLVKYATPPSLLGTTIVDRYARIEAESLSNDPFGLAECIASFRNYHFSVAERKKVKRPCHRTREVLVEHEIFDEEISWFADVVMAHLSQQSGEVRMDIANRFFIKLAAREAGGRRALARANNLPEVEYDLNVELGKEAFMERIKLLARGIPANQWTEEERNQLQSTITEDVNDLWELLFGEFKGPSDPPEEPVFSRQLLDRALKKLLADRFELRVALIDSHAAVNSISKFLAGTAVCMWVMILVLLFAGDSNSYNVWVGLTGFFVALAVVLGPTLQALFQNIVFLFFRHPMDVGDLVSIDDDFFTVERMELISTTLRRWDGLVQQRTNDSLSASVIANITRTKNFWQTIKFSIDVQSARGEFFTKAKDMVHAYLALHPSSFTGDFQLCIIGLVDPMQIQLELYIELRYSRSRTLTSIFDDITRCHLITREILVELHATRSGVGMGALMLHPEGESNAPKQAPSFLLLATVGKAAGI